MNEQQQKIRAWKIATGLGGILILLFIVLTIKELASIGHVGDSAPVNTITLNGTGDAYAIPDVATFTFTVTDTEKTVAAAQTKATAAANAALTIVRAAGVADKDIRTENYSINPHYEYQNAVCPQPAVYSSGASSGSGGVMIPSTAPVVYCPSGKSVITGYDVSESVSIKLRDLSKAGSLLASLGSAGVQNLNGPSFDVDNPDAIQAEARGKAISDARNKANALASELGVRIVRVVSFSDNNGSYQRPMVYAMDSSTGAAAPKAAAPEIVAGQQKVTDTVTVTYQIQ